MVLALGGIVARLAVLQVRESGAYEALGVEQRVRTEQLSAHRAEILDRNGSPLAITLDARDVYANPTLVTDPIGEAASLAPLLGLARPGVTAALQTPDTTITHRSRAPASSSSSGWRAVSKRFNTPKPAPSRRPTVTGSQVACQTKPPTCRTNHTSARQVPRNG